MSLYKKKVNQESVVFFVFIRAVSHLFPLFSRSLAPPLPPPESQVVSLLQRLVGALGYHAGP
jgi:hypothetical protein